MVLRVINTKTAAVSQDVTPLTEVASSSETSVLLYQTTRCHSPQYSNILTSRRYDELRCHRYNMTNNVRIHTDTFPTVQIILEVSCYSSYFVFVVT